MIPKEIVNDIIERAQVDEVVGEFVNLKKRGTNYLGLCPFHQEKTPSFTVSPNKGIYKCFGCGQGGDSVKFLMEHEHYTYPEALRYLAKKYGIEVPEQELTDEQKETYSQRESIYIVLDFAQKFYQEQLKNSDQGELIALPYVKERGISDESIENFMIGYSPGGWDVFSNAALKAGYKEEYLVEAGLSIKRDNGNLIDRFRERIMFPIHSLSGRTIGFGGRIMKTEKKEAKYINSPDSEVYNKSEVLYGLFQGKKEAKSTDLCYIVEGYTDVISLHQKGVTNVAASSGTSLTEGHLRLVKRYTNNICFLFDGDAAGIKASLRAIDLALEEGLNVKALALPEGEDPDSFAKAHNTAEIKAFLEDNAKDFIIFKTDLLLPEVGDDPIKKADAVVQIVKSIALIPDTLKRSIYVQQCAKQLRIEETVLVTELNKQLTNVLKQKEKKWKEENERNEVSKVNEEHLDIERQDDSASIRVSLKEKEERILVQFILHFGHLVFSEDMTTVAEYILEFLEEYDAHPENELLKVILDEYESHLENWGVAELKEFYQHKDQKIRELTITLTEERYVASENWVKKIGFRIDPSIDYKKTIQRLLDRFVSNRVIEMIDLAREDFLKPDLSDDERILLLKVIKKLNEKKVEMFKKIERVYARPKQ